MPWRIRENWLPLSLPRDAARRRTVRAPNIPQHRQTILFCSPRPSRRLHGLLDWCPRIALPACALHTPSLECICAALSAPPDAGNRGKSQHAFFAAPNSAKSQPCAAPREKRCLKLGGLTAPPQAALFPWPAQEARPLLPPPLRPRCLLLVFIDSEIFSRVVFQILPLLLENFATRTYFLVHCAQH